VALGGCLLGGPPPGTSPVPCPPPNISGWVHYETQYTRGFKPGANWQVSDGNNFTTVSSPTGSAYTGLVFGPNTVTQWTHPDQVINGLLINPSFGQPSITNFQIINATNTYSFAGGLQRDYEFVGTNQTELLQPGRAVHGWYTALVVPSGDFWLGWMELSYSDIWAGICGTLFQIRTMMSRIPQGPAGGFEVAAVENTAAVLPEGFGG